MNGNVIVKEYEFDKPLIQKIDSISDDCIRGCHNKYFHTFDHYCEYDNKLTNISNIEISSTTISEKSMGLFELNEKLKLEKEVLYLIK